MIEQIKLRDSTDAFAISLRPTDKAALVAGFEALTPDSRRHRFLASVKHLSESMLERLVDDVDGIDHTALVLCVETSPDVYDPVAVARMVRYADVPDAADLAVTVKDEWQGRGVATGLLDVLMRQRPVGVDRIVTEVFNDNEASLSMLRRLGHTTVKDVGSGVSEVAVELPPVPSVAGSRVPSGQGAIDDTRVLVPGPSASAVPRPLLSDPGHRHALRTRDQVCPWFN
ncbi:GNAT family N-acetyltransferase [Nocardioides zhouii]|uniref:GNAT family N-acetyltransferase n=1 Tax=Nocardioides zhouii TaxID=1168729 RepID=A0A4V1RQM5_9ACTN|nr:GNAT family N-acetyltransferase [Nocardioides zhouii]RYC13377.1 GNAT family N-acetyltransferase [Nocardioides zhouii]